MFIKFPPVIFLFLAIFIWGNCSFAAQETTIQKILADRDSYDGQEVSVVGRVSILKLKTSKGGSDYTTFSLLDESGVSLTIFVWGQSKLNPGQEVKVTGTYWKYKRISRHNYYNVIEATEIET